MPIELIEFELCKRFGWTPDELDRQDAQLIDKFITIISLKNQFKEAARKQNNG